MSKHSLFIPSCFARYSRDPNTNCTGALRDSGAQLHMRPTPSRALSLAPSGPHITARAAPLALGAVKIVFPAKIINLRFRRKYQNSLDLQFRQLSKITALLLIVFSMFVSTIKRKNRFPSRQLVDTWLKTGISLGIQPI